MLSACFCLRPALDASHSAKAPCGQRGLHATGGSNGATPGPQTVTVQQPVRAVSPADVRRTESGNIKQKADAGLQAIREASTNHMRVLGGCQMMGCGTSDPLKSSSEGARLPPGVQHLSDKRQAKRILQPVNIPLTDCKQQKTLLQLLRPSKKTLKAESMEPASVSCKSIMEASEQRLRRYKQAAATTSAAVQMAVIQTFSDAYLLAVSTGDQQWANAAQIAASFSPNAVLKTQDKQTFYGKPAVLKRLNSGATASGSKLITVVDCCNCCKDNNCWWRRCWYSVKAFGQWQ